MKVGVVGVHSSRTSPRPRTDALLVAMVAALVAAVIAVVSFAAPGRAQTYPPPPAPDQDTVLDGSQGTPSSPGPAQPPVGGGAPTDPPPGAPAPAPAPTPPAGPPDSVPPTTPSPEQPPQAGPVVDDDGGPWAWLLAGAVVALASLFLLLGRRRSREDETGNTGAAA